MSIDTIRPVSGGQGGQPRRRIHKPDLIITSVLLAAFMVAYAMATAWRDLAAYFPLGVSGAGIVASATLLIRVLFFPPRRDTPKAEVPDAAKSVAEQEYEFFKNLTGRDWLISVGWLGGFFLALAVFGIYVAVAAFTLGYLRFQTAKTWWFAAVYAALLGGVIYGIFRIALKLPLPGGLFGLA
ncbi:tripartite tricarboxylate transporter TctB family protein [Pseudarthrobacter phenanthrenivorans]|uniref:Tripartite tricarboxylate transporter TctB family protein n=1 Tax=Pseudarthrobacter phenanthrenivorans TaxID=361575 RepID=A0A3B0FPI6_PSEPS|nr:tripartite tricarboxylate transporter TctB family protein [Pseudarthrobacter phenanthrenivorans]RKO20397.1 tripartite tricarboxylate transporter TctB family protein [Pseudarthrobacter phenanthrenivorans]